MSAYIPANLPGSLQTAESDISNLQNEYSTATYSAVFDGGDTDTAAAYTVVSSRYGKKVTVSIPNITLTAIGVPAAFYEYKATVLGSVYRPTYDINVPVMVTDNTNVNQIGILEITTAGVIRIYANINKTSTWTAAPATCGWVKGLTISYSLQ